MASEKFAPTIDKVGNVRHLSSSSDNTEDYFESVYFPENRLSSDTAYGGFPLAVAVRSAFETIDSNKFSIYSVLGNFLGPTLSQYKLRVKVRRVRDTRSFVTRLLEVSQLIPNTKSSSDTNTTTSTSQSTTTKANERLVMTLTCDFHRPEPALITSYPHPKPQTTSYCPLAEAKTEPQLEKLWLSRGAPKKAVDTILGLFRLTDKFFDRRITPNGVMTQNIYGFAGDSLSTNQDHLPSTDRTSGDYVLVKGKLSSTAEHAAALAFYADSGLSFLGLVHNSMPFYKASVYATLEFALRFHVSDVRFDEWIYRELRLVNAAEGRTLGEASYWDPAGRLVCTSSQVCIMRPAAGAGIKAKV